MNKIVSYIIFLAAFFGITTNAQSQVMVICAGTDSIKLKAGNYHYGTIEWEQSIDNINWTKINGANDTVYQFMPTETRYYRAVNKFSDCPPEYSQVSKVQMPPVANAGGDRTIPDTSVVLMGFLEEGASGAWSVSSGTGGSFSNTGSPSAVFQGSDSLYTLVWSVSNDCGTSSDTVNIQFRNNTYIETLVVVDTTDALLSDSAQMAAGQYIIVFSTPVPSIGDSTILIGLAGEGFLRKVTSFTANGDTLCIQTEQATLEDITINGAYDVAQVFNLDTTLGGSKSAEYKRLNHMPTRAELTNDPKFKTGNYYYLVKKDPIYTYPGVSIKKNNSKNAGTNIDLQFNQAIINSGNINLTLSGNYSFTPNLQADLDYSGLSLESFRLGLYNAVIEQNLGLNFTASASASLLDHDFTLFSANHNIIIVIGAVPVWIKSQLKIAGEVSAEASASINIGHEITKTTTFTAAIEYENGSWSYPYSQTDNTVTENNFSVTGELAQTFEIGPSFTFKIYDIVGPYIDGRLVEELSLCSYNTNWQANADISGSLTVGAKAQIISENPLFTLNFTLFDVNKTWSQGFYSFQFPHSIEMISGNNQEFSPGTALPNPVKIKVISNKGFSLPGALVHFNPQDGGSVSNSIVFTDVNGYAQTTWTPTGTGTNHIEAYLLDCDGNYIDNSPMAFTAYPDNACANSSLSAYVNVYGSTIAPAGLMGVPPYQYSTDGLNFSNTAPVITVTPGTTYLITVKDGNDCLASANYFAPNPCVNSGLSLSLSVMGNTITASAAGGAGPYQYALDVSSGSYSSSNIFTNVSQGNHTVYVQDANSCTASSGTQVTSVPSFTCGSSTITDYDGNVYNTVQIGSQCWMKENLKTTHYADGSAMVQGTGTSNITGDFTTKYWFVYNDNISNKNTYGLLYTWAAVVGNGSGSNANPSGVQGSCPQGWHVSSDAEWKQMEMFLGMSQSQANSIGYRGTIEGGKLKEAGSSHWPSPNSGATNESCFTALPGGGYDGGYSTLGTMGYWWTISEESNTNAWRRILTSSNTQVDRNGVGKNIAHSVRCIKDYDTAQSNYYCGNSTICDYDGNIYSTIQIGSQCWMQQNLATTHYADGIALVDGTSAGDIFGNYTTKYWFVYNNTMSNKATYGLLYTWAAVMNGAAGSNNNPSGVQGICPTGWHVPSDAEWMSLILYLGGYGVAGGKLKEAGTIHWYSPNTGATNVSGFTALPGGTRLHNGYFYNIGEYGFWWSTTVSNASYAWYRYLNYYSDIINSNEYLKTTGYSVRCLRDN
jgi:uncharacterized protein (TIGR02145 family)